MVLFNRSVEFIPRKLDRTVRVCLEKNKIVTYYAFEPFGPLTPIGWIVAICRPLFTFMVPVTTGKFCERI